jgi:hypothetical protein
MIAGSNWWLGYSHCTQAKSQLINCIVKDRRKIADIIEVFVEAGIDAVMGQIQQEPLADAVREAQDRTGKKIIFVSTPTLPVTRETPAKGFDAGELERLLDVEVSLGATFCMPHTTSTDALVDRCTREVRQMATVCRMIRERGMIPGLSTHLPETIVYSDETGLDVETYISIYNLMGFLMPLEVDWTQRIIHNAKKPVMTIKPMAAGQVRPLQGLAFSWSTLRPCDMVTVGTMTPDEAKELIDLSLSLLEGRQSDVELQETRSKSSVKAS